MMALKGLVTYHKSFETQNGNQIIPEFFCELELDLGHKKIRKDQEAIFTISGIGSFEMYFSGLVVQGENVRGISEKENLFLRNMMRIIRIFLLRWMALLTRKSISGLRR